MAEPLPPPVGAFPRACFAGWVSLVILHALLTFAIPHGSDFAPEVGIAGGFILFGVIFSVMYLGDFIVIGFLAYSVPSVFSTRHWLSALRGAALFALSVPLWCIANQHYYFLDIVMGAAVAAVPGATSFYVLSRSRKENPALIRQRNLDS